MLNVAKSPTPRNPLPVPWKVAEHISVIGDTGTGKTFLIDKLVQLRQFVVFLRTKPDQTVIHDVEHVRTADAMFDLYSRRLIIDVAGKSLAVQRKEALAMLNNAWRQGGWTIVVDELFYVAEKLKILSEVETLLTQGRSLHLSIVTGMQRPVRISRFAMAESTHLFSFILEGRDLMTLKEATTPRIVPAVDSLTNHRFAYFHRRLRIVATGDAKYLDQVIWSP